jgi:hypothetical protein
MFLLRLFRTIFESIFGDWRTQDVSLVDLRLDPSQIYYFLARTCGFKGWLGGTHSWMGFWSEEKKRWLVLELSDIETVSIQKANILFATTDDLFDRGPILSDRDPRQKWFGAIPRIVDQQRRTMRTRDVIEVSRRYPFSDYRLLSRNCNTFFSFANLELGVHFRRPFRCVGYRSKTWWEKRKLANRPRDWVHGFTRFATGLLAASTFLQASADVPLGGVPTLEAQALYAEDFGVEASLLEEFFRSARHSADGSTGRSTQTASGDSSMCVHRRTRDALLKCLTSYGGSGLNQKLFVELFEKNEALLRTRFDRDTEKTIALQNYILDLARQEISKSSPAAWFVPGDRRFLNLTSAQRNEFPFEDGDLVLTYGGAGTSSLIGRLSSPVYRLSHALIVRKRNGVLSTVEVLPQSGAAEFPFEFFKGETYYHMKVLRWRDKAKRAEVATKAAALASTWAASKIPFDVTFSSVDDRRLYCTLLGALAYSQASGQALADLFSDQSATAAPSYLQVARAIGTETGNHFVSPMTLIRSSAFETVAEFRDTEHLMHFWRVEAAVSETAAAYASGQKIRPNWFYRHLDFVFALPLLNRIAIVAKSQSIVGLVGLEKFSTLATLEKKIVEKAVRGPDGGAAEADLLSLSLWAMRDDLHHEFEKIRSSIFEASTDVALTARSVRHE